MALAPLNVPLSQRAADLSPAMLSQLIPDIASIFCGENNT